MKTYQRRTLNDLIAGLEMLPYDAPVRGLDGCVHSYRGYYERNATKDLRGGFRKAGDLAARYRASIGDPIHGWKGGEYKVQGEELIYYADYGDTGPCILGLEPNDQGVYELILLADDHHYD
ncbi:hypothetical protein BJD55_gp042 [Gordonia phage Yvonnetastic]|uniref:Uncharacterized protein n=1 Tax=Gordonia phage Yvonnetastic TaxID=1821566 RepID=A0A142K9E1_9CAUD|nr:hypothetical protein BJD55_gp042 [Gordonia phage Yvonnetastic]AMS02724.1 hypothetical protein SEA_YVONNETASTIC_180 [Gordonia phage Yvonnetastic]WKW86153.1 hypothetical protein SEA_JONJAMES_180 [Gordonia Phage JonJames]